MVVVRRAEEQLAGLGFVVPIDFVDVHNPDGITVGSVDTGLVAGS